jgi:hypothetical protein
MTRVSPLSALSENPPAAPNTIVVDIDMEAGTALVHQLAGAPEPDAHPAAPG